MAQRIPRPGEFYRHFKNRLYQIVAVAEHSETGETMVVYQALYGDFKIYVRPLEMFLEEVDHDKYPRVTQKYRFEPVKMPGNRDEQLSHGEEENERRGAAHRTERRSAGRGIQADPERKIRTEIHGAEAEGSRSSGFVLEKESAEKRMKREAEEKQALLDTWNQAAGLSDFEDYEEADELAEQESVVIPRSGRAEETEDDLWESLTDEAVEAAKEQGEDEEAADAVNPHFLDFLEARTFESKAVILETMREELDDELIDGLAMAVDVEIPAGPIEERYHQLRQCLETMAKYEDTRLR